MRHFALLRWTLQILATVGLVAVALLRVDLQEVGAALERADYGWAGAALTMLTAGKVLAAARWRLYLSGVGKPPLLGLTAAYAIGSFLNTLLPFRAGDIAKIQIVASRYGLPRAGLTSSVFAVEGLLDLVTLLALLLLGLAFMDVSFLPAALLWPLVFLSGSAFAVAVLLTHLFPHELPAFRLPSIIPASISDGIKESWPAFIDGLLTLRRSKTLLQAIALHFLEWSMRAGAMVLFGMSFSLDVPISTFLVLTVALSVFTLLPVTFMNIGTYQVVALEVLHAAGAPRSEAFAYSVTAQALSYVWVSLMGLAALWALQLWPGQVSSSLRQAQDRSESGEPSASR